MPENCYHGKKLQTNDGLQFPISRKTRWSPKIPSLNPDKLIVKRCNIFLRILTTILAMKIADESAWVPADSPSRYTSTFSVLDVSICTAIAAAATIAEKISAYGNDWEAPEMLNVASLKIETTN